jgi:uncharacterized delta-60 repeat protein
VLYKVDAAGRLRGRSRKCQVIYIHLGINLLNANLSGANMARCIIILSYGRASNRQVILRHKARIALTPVNIAATIEASVVIVSPLRQGFKEAGMSKHLKTVLCKSALISMVLGLLGYTIALAASGELDPTFSGDGKVITDLNAGSMDLVGGLAVQSNGKIIVVGTSNDNFAVVRYNSNGTLDATFSGDGKAFTNFGGIETTEDVAIQSNGKIVVNGNDPTPEPID